MLSCNSLHYFMNITFFMGGHGRLSPRGNIVDRGVAEMDNAFRVVSIYHTFNEKLIFILYRKSPFPVQLQYLDMELLHAMNKI